jgi:hypothetical protein
VPSVRLDDAEHAAQVLEAVIRHAKKLSAILRTG